MVGCKHRWHCTIYSAIEYTRYIRRLEEVSAFITDPLLIRDLALIRGPTLLTFIVLKTRRLLEAGGYERPGA